MQGEGAGKHDLLCYTRHKGLDLELGPKSHQGEPVKPQRHACDVWSVRCGRGDIAPVEVDYVQGAGDRCLLNRLLVECG